MTIKEIKAGYEKATKLVISKMLAKEIKVETGYNSDSGTMNVTLVNNTKGRDNEAIIVVYSISYVEDTKLLTVSAIARHLISDYFGVANIVYEPIGVDESFIKNIKDGIQGAMEHYEEIIAAAEEKKESVTGPSPKDSIDMSNVTVSDAPAPAAVEPTDSTESN